MKFRVILALAAISLFTVPARSNYLCLRLAYSGTACHGNNWDPSLDRTPCLAGDEVSFRADFLNCGLYWQFPDGTSGNRHAFPLAGNYVVRAILASPPSPMPSMNFPIQIVYGFAIKSVSAMESDGAATITIIRGAPPGTASTIEYATSDDTATAGIHYVATAGTLTFAPGELQKTVTVPLIQDDGFRYASFYFSISDPSLGGMIGQTKRSVLIVDDEPPPVVGFAEREYIGHEGGGLDVTIARTGSADLAFRVYLKVSSSSDLADTYADFAAGEVTKLVHFDIPQNDCFGSQGFPIELLLPLQPNGVLLSPTHRYASVSLTDDEPVPTLTMGDVSIAEGSSDMGTPAQFRLAASGRICNSSEPLLVRTQDGTATSTGGFGQDDFISILNDRFRMRGNTADISVIVRPDRLMEPDETFSLEAGWPQWPMTLTRATGTIINDDGPPAVVTMNPPDAGLVTPGSHLGFTVVFGVPVRGIDPTDFAVIEDGVNGSRILEVGGAGNDSSYAVTMSVGGAARRDGTVALQLVDDDTIIDVLGTPLGGPGLGNGNAASAPVAVHLGEPIPVLDPVALAMLTALLAVVALASLRA